MRYAIAVGLAVGAVLGLLGSFLPPGPPQNGSWEVSSVGLIVGAALLAARLARSGQDTAATGFALLVVAEAVMSSGTAAQPPAIAAFGAGVALYVPALILVSLPRIFPAWSRVAGFAATVPFALEAYLVFAGRPEPPTGPIASAGYALMTVAIVGWILQTVRKSS